MLENKGIEEKIFCLIVKIVGGGGRGAGDFRVELRDLCKFSGAVSVSRAKNL